MILKSRNIFCPTHRTHEVPNAVHSPCKEQGIQQLDCNNRFILADSPTAQMPLVIRQASLFVTAKLAFVERARYMPGVRNDAPEEATDVRDAYTHIYMRACIRARARTNRRGCITWTPGRQDHPCPRPRRSRRRALFAFEKIEFRSGRRSGVKNVKRC